MFHDLENSEIVSVCTAPTIAFLLTVPPIPSLPQRHLYLLSTYSATYPFPTNIIPYLLSLPSKYLHSLNKASHISTSYKEHHKSLLHISPLPTQKPLGQVPGSNLSPTWQPIQQPSGGPRREYVIQGSILLGSALYLLNNLSPFNQICEKKGTLF